MERTAESRGEMMEPFIKVEQEHAADVILFSEMRKQDDED